MAEQAEASQLVLPPVDQLGFVVRSMDQALPHYSAVFGKLELFQFPLDKMEFRGKTTDVVLNVALGRPREDDVEIELIEVVSGSTPHSEFLERGRDGIQHLGFAVERVEPWLEKTDAAGYQTVWYRRVSDDTAFAYAEHRSGNGLMLEFLELPGRKIR